MKKFISAIFIFCLLAFGTHKESSEPVIALKGFDPVALTQGKEVQGKEDTSLVRGRYKYLFASEENKALFEKNPEQYMIQMGGACGRMGPLSGVGDHDRFYVHNERIYIFASQSCCDNFKANPEIHIDIADTPPTGSKVDEKRGRDLIELALKGFGGAEKIDASRH
ncbi:MAG: hypothetical protein ACE5I1_03955 [bacterium]